MSEIIEAIDHVIARIKDEKHWTQGVNARDKNNQSTNPRDFDACSWCSNGAMIAEYLPRNIQNKIDNRFWVLYHMSISSLNDCFTHQEIMDAWSTVRLSFLAEEAKEPHYHRIETADFHKE